MKAENVIQVNPAMLVSVLKKISRAQPVGIIARTIPEMRRKRNPFYLGNGVFDVARIRKATGFIRFRYASCVNRRRAREGRPEDFQAEPRAWGQRFYRQAGDVAAAQSRNGRSPLIRHHGRWYLNLKRETVIRTEHRRISTDEPIDDAELTPFLRSDDGRYERKRQGVTRPVIVRDYAVENIAWLTMERTLYVMTPCPNTSLPSSNVCLPSAA